ncbi:MAG: hypothetical protein ACLSB9_00500 [Hydrogeniiclostridium mannosilyticum]
MNVDFVGFRTAFQIVGTIKGGRRQNIALELLEAELDLTGEYGEKVQNEQGFIALPYACIVIRYGAAVIGLGVDR